MGQLKILTLMHAMSALTTNCSSPSLYINLYLNVSLHQVLFNIYHTTMAAGASVLERERPRCEAHLVCRNEVYEDGIQQLLRDPVSLRDDRTHQVHHVHLHFLIMAVTVRRESAYSLAKYTLMH